MSAPTDLSGWIATPARLNPNKCGLRAQFSNNYSVVQRTSPGVAARDCVCFTYLPLHLGQLWQITVLKRTREWTGGLVSDSERGRFSL